MKEATRTTDEDHRHRWKINNDKQNIKIIAIEFEMVTKFDGPNHAIQAQKRCQYQSPKRKGNGN